jgi:MFS family permease
MSDANSISGAAPRDRRRWVILGVIGIAQLMVVLDVTIMNIALPSAQRSLHFATVDRQWVVTAYTWRSAACSCSAGGWPTCSGGRSRS